MTRVAIKICGLTTIETIDAAVRGGASHVGFVHFAKSPRHVAPEKLAVIAQRVPSHVKRVAVLVDPDDMTIDGLIAAGGIQALQLHGKEAPARVAQLRQRTGLDVWKAISVKTAADLAAGAAYAGAADMLLYDAKTPDGAALPGGMGMRFDWSLLAGHRASGPWGLSGGLDPENVAEAIRITGAPLVDVSSGVESAPGVKNVDKIAAFCKAVSQC
jgi:phosphoribosylanthranilate isomerase